MSAVFDKLGKYIVVKKVGKGSTGDIYLSHDPFYGRDVAIKVYKSEHVDEHEAEAQRKMFFNEAHMVGMLQHPNILPIYDAGEEDGRYFVVMEFILWHQSKLNQKRSLHKQIYFRLVW